jgi:predicted nucleotidyltransferase
MKALEESQELESVRALATATAGLDLLLLFGSRGRGDASPESDWDFAYLGDCNVARLRADLTLRLKTDQIDLMDLSRAGGLARFRAARDGLLIYESREGVFERFWFESVRFWLDARDVLEPSYDAVLASIDS